MKKLFPIFFLSAILFSCGGDDDDDNGGTLFEQLTGLTPANDVELGMQVDAEIRNNPDQFPILDETEFSESYTYLNAMMTDILESNDIEYRNLFAWELSIIGDDETLNAFATPGGYIYVYTGLIKFLDNADDLAGVMGHEIAHADLRHSSDQMKQQFGLSLISSILLGGQSDQVSQIVNGLAGLSFSRSDESEADEYSVIYLGDTDYACNGAAAFFQKLIDSGSAGGTPEFLSTHPNPDNRVEDINAKATSDGCSTDLIAETGMTYAEFIASLP